jgi:8-oxo-dGTP diphosphatase
VIHFQVVVGVIKNALGQVLISLRHDDLHQGGLWEFPGGKVEQGESDQQALVRELKEELGITVHSACPLITINHRYPDRSVQLRVYTVADFTGTAQGLEKQDIKWVDADKLSDYDFPAANLPIITAARLPVFYAILDDSDEISLLDKLNTIINQDIKLIQARFKRLPKTAIQRFLHHAYPLCKQHQVKLLLNSACVAVDMTVDSIHLTSRDLLTMNKRPAGVEWLAAACHNLEELQHAEAIGVDFAALAPVKPTPTHPGVATLGWDGFAALVSQVNLPVYALGGVSKADVSRAQHCGGQGIAAIRAFLG